MNPLPNIKSSIRSVKTDAERRAKNAAEKSAVRTAAKKVEAQVAEGNKAEAEVTLKKASSLLDACWIKRHRAVLFPKMPPPAKNLNWPKKLTPLNNSTKKYLLTE